MIIDFEIANGEKVLINVNAISAVIRYKDNSCRIYMVGPDAEPWIVKGSLKEIEEKIWKAHTNSGVF